MFRLNSAVRRTLVLFTLALMGAPTLLLAEIPLFSEDFSAGLGAMNPVAVCGSGAVWEATSTCASSPSAPSTPGHAHFGQPGCVSYSGGNVTARLDTPEIDVSACRGDLSVRFSYLLDLQEGASDDRARVNVYVDGVKTSMANNGYFVIPTLNCSGVSNTAAVAQLVADATWHSMALDLSSHLPAASLRVGFLGETTNNVMNGGEGLLIDDLEILCGEPGDETQVNTYTTSSQNASAVAAMDDGFIVAWVSNGSSSTDTNGSSIHFQRFHADGRHDGSQRQANTYTTGSQYQPAVALAPDGSFLVTWVSLHASGPDDDYSIQGQFYDSSGVKNGVEKQVNTYTTGTQQRPAVAASNDGGFVVVYDSAGSPGSDTDNISVLGQRYNSDGSTNGTEFQVNSYTTSVQSTAAAAATPDGGFIVTWHSVGSTGTDTDGVSVQAQRFYSNGTFNGAQFQVNSVTADDQMAPTIAVENSGDFVIAWSIANFIYDDASLPKIRGQRFYSDGSFKGAEFEVNTTTTGSQYGARVAAHGDGAFLVSWTSSLPYGVYARRFSSAGAPRGDDFQVNNIDLGIQPHPAVAAGGGHELVAWQSDNSYGNDTNLSSVQYRDLAHIFTDGFESGNTGAWSVVVP